jgi:hypothetical protein
MQTNNAAQGDGFAALEIRSVDKLIHASVDDLGLAGLVDLRAQVDIQVEGDRPLFTTERRWFKTQDEAATWLTSQVLAALWAERSM